MSRLAVIFILLFIIQNSFSQSGKLETEAEVIIQSRHVWRGEKLGSSISVEPSVLVRKGRFSFNGWAAVTPDNSYSEVDLIPSWQFNYFQVSLLDYYNPQPGEKNQYLNFQDQLNRHSVEVSLDNYAVEKHRLKWMAATFILGDQNEDTGRPLYSTYIELSYPFTLWQIDAEPFAGFTPSYGYYAEEFSFVNTGITFSKEIPLRGPFTIPLSLSAIYNPYTQNRFVTFATGIAF